jgi:hypothetical protein
MPQQVKRLLGLFVAIVVIFIIVRRIFVPPSFGKYGHYRATSISSIVSQEIKYAGEITCAECHDDIVSIKNKSYHRGLSCEVCHGPAYAHTQAPDEVELPAPKKRSYCPLCHGYNPSRPTGFPQIDPARHNPLKPCITCHNPHDPRPPTIPRECDPCHTEIARTKIVSPHALLPCTQCHEARDEHKVYPRKFLPSKPESREFCGQCHAEEAKSPPEIPRVDLSTHGNATLCWECHYPHSPEAHVKEEEIW